MAKTVSISQRGKDLRRVSVRQCVSPQRLQGGVLLEALRLAKKLYELVEHAGRGAPDAVAIIRKGRD